MVHNIAWHDTAQSILRIDIAHEGPWDEIHATIDQVIPKMASVTHRVDIVFNSTVNLPAGNPIPNLKATSKRLAAQPNMGLFVSVNPRRLSSFIKMMIDIIGRIYGIDRQHYGGFVNTMDEAVAIIMQDRARTEAAT